MVLRQTRLLLSNPCGDLEDADIYEVLRMTALLVLDMSHTHAHTYKTHARKHTRMLSLLGCSAEMTGTRCTIFAGLGAHSEKQVLTQSPFYEAPSSVGAVPSSTLAHLFCDGGLAKSGSCYAGARLSQTRLVSGHCCNAEASTQCEQNCHWSAAATLRFPEVVLQRQVARRCWLASQQVLDLYAPYGHLSRQLLQNCPP
eukprot:scaffold46081_cov22-Tisochrysis_lutea.AAC.4